MCNNRLQELNGRFASYIEKVQFLEAQNHRLAADVENLARRRVKQTTQIKAMYGVELQESRRLVDDVEKNEARLKIRCASLEKQLEETRQK